MKTRESIRSTHSDGGAESQKPLRVAPLDRKTYDEFWKRHGEEIFAHEVEFRFFTLLGEQSLARLAQRDAAYQGGPKWTFGIWAGNELVGIHSGQQKEHAVYHMGISGVLPAWRRRGCYAALLSHVLAFAAAEGFEGVSSRHNAVNNPVLIAKLRAGFFISGFEVNDVQGLLVHLMHYFNEDRRRVHAFRTGARGLTLREFTAFTNLCAENDASESEGTGE